METVKLPPTPALSLEIVSVPAVVKKSGLVPESIAVIYTVYDPGVCRDDNENNPKAVGAGPVRAPSPELGPKPGPNASETVPNAIAPNSFISRNKSLVVEPVGAVRSYVYVELPENT